MTADAVNRLVRPVPLILSLCACALAIGAILSGATRAPDEGWQAHLFQLLMVAQLPFIAIVLLTGRWSEPRRLVVTGAGYALAICAALAPVAIAGL